MRLKIKDDSGPEAIETAIRARLELKSPGPLSLSNEAGQPVKISGTIETGTYTLQLGEEEMSLQHGYRAALKAYKLGQLPLVSKVIEVSADTSITDTVQLLTKHGIHSAPVFHKGVTGTWTERYAGLVSALDVLLFVLEAVEDQQKFVKSEGQAFLELTQAARKFDKIPVSKIIDEAAAPFVPISSDSSLLDAMWLMNQQQHCHRLVVVDHKSQKVSSIITQSMVLKYLVDNKARLTGIMDQSLKALGIGQRKPFSVRDTDPVIEACRLMRKHRLTAVPVLGSEGLVVGTISTKDIRLMVQSRKPGAILLILRPIKDFLRQVYKGSLMVTPPAVVVHHTDTLGATVDKLATTGIHRVWVLDGIKLKGVVSLTDVIQAVVGNAPLRR